MCTMYASRWPARHSARTVACMLRTPAPMSRRFYNWTPYWMPRVERKRFRAPQQSIPFLVKSFLKEHFRALLWIAALLCGAYVLFKVSQTVRRVCACTQRTGAAAWLLLRLMCRDVWYLRLQTTIHHLVHEDNALMIRDFLQRHGPGTVYMQLMQLACLASPHSPLFGAANVVV